MKAVLTPLTDAIDQLVKGQTANAKAIKTLANRKQEPLIPKEVTKLLPGLINGVIKIFTTPDTPAAEAGKGIFNEKMMTAYQNSMIKTWNANASMQEANLESINLENKLRSKRLSEEF